MSDFTNTLHRASNGRPARSLRHELREGFHVKTKSSRLLLKEGTGPGGALLVRTVFQKRVAPRLHHHEPGRVTSDLNGRGGAGTEDCNGSREGPKLALLPDGASDEFAAAAGDPDADRDSRWWLRNLGDDLPKRLGRLANDGAAPDAKQFPLGTDKCQLDRDRSDIDAERVRHSRLSVRRRQR